MSAKHGRNTAVWFGASDLSQYLKAFDTTGAVELLDGTHFQSTDKEFVAGFRDGKISVEGFFESDDVDAAAIDDILGAALGVETKTPLTIAPEGGTVGQRALLSYVDESSYKVSAAAAGLIMSNAEFQSSSGIQHGLLLAVGALTATGNGAAQDNGAATEKGGVAHLHIISVSGTTPSLTGKLQHSADGSTWADLISFNAATAAGWQRVELPADEPVEAQLRFIRTITGTTPSFTVACAFARR